MSCRAYPAPADAHTEVELRRYVDAGDRDGEVLVDWLRRQGFMFEVERVAAK